MLEFYQAFADYHDMMDFVERLLIHTVKGTLGTTEVVFQGRKISFEAPFRRIRFMEALEEALGSSATDASEEELRALAEERRIPELEGAGRGKLLDKLFGELVEPDIWQPTFVMDYPRELSPLAKPTRDGSPSTDLTERFELMAAGKELANAFSELNDPLDQRSRFEDQARLRAGGDEEAQQIDEDYIRALEYGMPPTGGVGIGVDRLAMIVTDQSSIRDVILFPALREEEQEDR
jgi:lysyl-tRNA synthetase class 2